MIAPKDNISDYVKIGRIIVVIKAKTSICMQFRFSAANLDLLNGTVCKIAETTTETFDPENMGVEARISFLSALELEILMWVN